MIDSGLTFVSVIPRKHCNAESKGFYNSLHLVFILIAAILFFLSGLTIYINYKPIILMVRRIQNLFGSGILPKRVSVNLKALRLP